MRLIVWVCVILDFPIRFGRKQLYLSTVGSGPITGARVNGKRWGSLDSYTVLLPYGQTPDKTRMQITLGGAKLGGSARGKTPQAERSPLLTGALTKTIQPDRRWPFSLKVDSRMTLGHGSGDLLSMQVRSQGEGA